MRVSFDDCVEELVKNNPESEYKLKEWEKRYERLESPREKVLQHKFISEVKRFTHEFLFRITASDVKKIGEETRHALGDLKSDTDPIQDVEDFYTPFAVEYFLHGLLEENKRLPTFQEFWGAMGGKYKKYYMDELFLKLGGKYDKICLKRAIQWRLGKFYYSWLRELYVLALLRENHGLALKYHLFADLVLSIDAWYGKKVLCIRVPSKYASRKSSPPHGFTIVEARIPRQGYGKPWLLDETELERIAQKFREP
ncbi:hypothetical protein [Ammonifex thiophilus]|uniref:Uncharacterized protein n=1 Tax=Ammonifex thiophilus TaxID=444093 RepID=A0A3D8P315_9THEO|nr:hypothetical protein [Ammonifex thiophilus]RDV82970.1 hypothetical protein DXX99_06100 [Ammonifex thiophilus]